MATLCQCNGLEMKTIIENLCNLFCFVAAMVSLSHSLYGMLICAIKRVRQLRPRFLLKFYYTGNLVMPTMRNFISQPPATLLFGIRLLHSVFPRNYGSC